MEVTLSEEQVAKFGEILEIGDGEDLDPDAMLAKLGELKEKAEAEPETPEGARQMSEQEFSELKADAVRAGKQAQQMLWTMRRDAFLDAAESAGKITPAAREQYERFYSLDEEETRKTIEELPVNEVLLREYGSDENGLEGTDEKAEERMFDELRAYRGAPTREAAD